MNVQLEGDDVVRAQEACGTSVMVSTPLSFGLYFDEVQRMSSLSLEFILVGESDILYSFTLMKKHEVPSICGNYVLSMSLADPQTDLEPKTSAVKIQLGFEG
jgi:hypothetical protein